ncbi:hypothetical protein [Actinomadura violacea]|uniref:Uncharacterized protein n=1 Tax=Actinomadura violacea TaxID=2819934 RepID=A0ABS3RY65_9ACTN|nr:hypothetical protein [Actinomadura violacea]MBO2461685.1 hypothetical protein [Actinomadura violacea]
MAVIFTDPYTKTRTVRFDGAVLDLHEQNLIDDSYFHAIVWDAAAQTVTSIEYGATAYAATGRAEVDATDDVRAAARAWAIMATKDTVRADHRALITEGTAVRSLTSRGKAKGLEGKVERIIDSKHDDPFTARNDPTKVALVVDEKSDRRAWVPTGRLEVTTPISEQQVTALAVRMVDERGAADIYRRRRFRR